jgi:hypothetical protein
MAVWLILSRAALDLVGFAVVPAAVTCAVHAVFRRFVPARKLLPHHDVAGFLVAVVGVLYAVVLGFLVVAVWSAFDSAQRNADSEAGELAEIFMTAQALPQADRARIQVACADYAFEVRDREWPMLRDGRQDGRARAMLVTIARSVAWSPSVAHPVPDQALREAAVRQALFMSLHEMSMERRQRLLDADSHLPALLYLALILDGAFVLAFVFLFGVEDRTLQLVMTGLVVASIGVLFGVIVAFDHPYAGGLRVSPTAWTLVIENNDLAHYRSLRP